MTNNINHIGSRILGHVNRAATLLMLFLTPDIVLQMCAVKKLNVCSPILPKYCAESGKSQLDPAVSVDMPKWKRHRFPRCLYPQVTVKQLE